MPVVGLAKLMCVGKGRMHHPLPTKRKGGSVGVLFPSLKMFDASAA